MNLFVNTYYYMKQALFSQEKERIFARYYVGGIFSCSNKDLLIRTIDVIVCFNQFSKWNLAENIFLSEEKRLRCNSYKIKKWSTMERLYLYIKSSLHSSGSAIRLKELHIEMSIVVCGARKGGSLFPLSTSTLTKITCFKLEFPSIRSLGYTQVVLHLSVVFFVVAIIY